MRLAAVQLDCVPQASTLQGLWLPTEPLYSGPAGPPRDNNSDLAVRNLFRAADTGAKVALELEAIIDHQVDDRLRAILAFLGRQAADVIVLPEYALPLHCLDTLIESSTDRAIVAGLGFVRNGQVARRLAGLDPSFAEGDLEGRNVAVLAANGRIHLVTKKDSADGEQLHPGRGPRIVEVELRGAKVRLGIAICKDFLTGSVNFAEQRVQVACIPARSASSREFIESAPRDFVRIFANDAEHGRSTILLPQVQSPFADQDKVHPVATAVEAVVTVEYHGYPRKPTPLAQKPNRLVCRSELIEADDEERLTVLRRLTEAERAGDDTLQATIRDVTAIARDGRPPTPFWEILEHVRGLIQVQHEPRDALRLLECYLEIPAGGRSRALRSRQAALVVERLRGIVPRPTWAGQAEDHYLSLIGDPAPATDSRALPRHTEPTTTPLSPQTAPASIAPAPRSPTASTPMNSLAGTAVRVGVLQVSAGEGAGGRGVALAVERDTVLIPLLDPLGAHPIQVRAPAETHAVEANLLWVRPAGDTAVARIPAQNGSWRTPPWGRLTTHGVSLPCVVPTIDPATGAPRTVEGRVEAAADPSGAHWLATEEPVPPGSPVLCGERCIGMVSGPGDTVLTAETVLTAAWRAGVLRTWPSFDAVEFRGHEIPPVAYSGSPPEDGHDLRAWAAGSGFDARPVPAGATGAVLQRFLQRQRLAGWVVLRMTTASLREQQELLRRMRTHTLVSVIDGQDHRDELVRMFGTQSRRPDEPAIRLLLHDRADDGRATVHR